jgi:hypothetical protein
MKSVLLKMRIVFHFLADNLSTFISLKECKIDVDAQYWETLSHDSQSAS